MISADISTVLPEILLAVYAMIALVAGVYTGKDKVAPTILFLTAAVMVVLAAMIGLSGGGTTTAFNGAFIDDGFARFAKVTILLAAAAVLVMSKDYMLRRDLLRFEYPILVALASVGIGRAGASPPCSRIRPMAWFMLRSRKRSNSRSPAAVTPMWRGAVRLFSK